MRSVIFYFSHRLVLLFFICFTGTAVADDISPGFTYQGMLSEGGSPVTGSRDMRFRVYSDDACTTNVGNNIIRNGVAIDNGVFSVELTLPLPPEDIFIGQGRWLGVRVEGVDIACQELQAVPYAFSLRPGAKIEGSKPSRWALYAENTATTGSNSGVRGETHSDDGAGVYAAGTISGADIILGGSFGRIDSDPTYAGSDIHLRSNDDVMIFLDEDDSELNERFEILNGTNQTVFKVEDNGSITGIASFPKPAYNSGWQSVGQNTETLLTHSLGGDPLDYVVDLTCYIPGTGNDGINNWGIGGDVSSYGYYGASWSKLTSTQIEVKRWSGDTTCPQFRIRIWKYAN